MPLPEKLYESRHLIPVMLLIAGVLGSIYAGVATATEAAAIGVVGSLILSAVQRSLNWQTFRDSLMGATRLYCMIALILSGAAFLTLSMGYIGLPRHLAEFVASLGLSPFMLIIALAIFYIILGCFLDGISMVVLTMGVILPTVTLAKIDLIWFGIFIVIVVEMAQITPPVGFNLFVLQGMTGKEITWIARVTLSLLPADVRDGAAAVVVSADGDLAAFEDVTAESRRRRMVHPGLDPGSIPPSAAAALHIQIESFHENQAPLRIHAFEPERYMQPRQAHLGDHAWLADAPIQR